MGDAVRRLTRLTKDASGSLKHDALFNRYKDMLTERYGATAAMAEKHPDVLKSLLTAAQNDIRTEIENEKKWEQLRSEPVDDGPEISDPDEEPEEVEETESA